VRAPPLAALIAVLVAALASGACGEDEDAAASDSATTTRPGEAEEARPSSVEPTEPAPASAGFRWYQNTDYGYRLRLPVAMVEDPGAQIEEGRRLLSRDGRTRLEVLGSPPPEGLDRAVITDLLMAGIDEVVERGSASAGATVAGFGENREFIYRQVILPGPDRMVILSFRYPEELRPMWDAVVDSVGPSLESTR
jgi:hypothetical protein